MVNMASESTLLLTKSDLELSMTIQDKNPTLESAFRKHAQGDPLGSAWFMILLSPI